MSRAGHIDIRDSVHYDIKLTDLERSVIDTEKFQRLRRLYQLPTIQYVFPSATHTRFSQSLGTLQIASKIGDNIKQDRELRSDEKKYLRLAALLYDIQDPPFYTIFYEDYKNEKTIEKVLSKIQYDRIVSIRDEIKRKASGDSMDLDLLMEVLTAGSSSNYRFIRQIIDSDVGADRIDYLIRDSYYCGVHYGQVDKRILTMFKIEEGSELVLNRESLPLVDDIFHSLFSMRYNIYDHKISRAVTRMIRETYNSLIETRKRGKENIIRYLAELDDYQFLNELMNFEEGKNINYVTRLVKHRDLLKTAYTLEAPALRDITFAKTFDELKRDEAQIEEEMRRSSSDVFLDMVPIKPPKTVALQVRINGESERVSLRDSPLLDQWYGKSRELGHGEGALSQWKMYVFSEQDKKDDVTGICKEFFEPFLLGSHETPKRKLKRLKKLYAQLESLRVRQDSEAQKYKIVSLPPTQFRTLMVLSKSSEMTATSRDVAKKKRRTVAAENMILRDLSDAGLVQKKRAGHSYNYKILPEVAQAVRELLESNLIHD